MNLKSKYRIIERPKFVKKNSDIEKRYTQHLYGSKSFLIKYYAFLPLIHSLKHITFSDNSRILDIGCSDGPFLPTLNYYAKSIIANDILENRVREAKNLIEFIENFGKEYSIIEISDSYGIATIDPEIDCIVVSEETLLRAEEINAIRFKKGLSKLTLVVVPIVFAEDGKALAGDRILKGEIDSEGKICKI